MPQEQPESSPQSAPASQPQHAAVRRPARSKTGCLTCRNRKVRCDETRPRCSHCFRLNLECRWRPPFCPPLKKPDGTVSQQNSGQAQGVNMGAAQTGNLRRTSLSSPSLGDGLLANPMQAGFGAVDQMFDYASFMWDAVPTVWGHVSPNQSNHSEADANANGIWANDSSMQAVSSNKTISLDMGHTPDSNSAVTVSESAHPQDGIKNQQSFSEDRNIMDYFIRAIVPPILAEVETQRRWSSVRQVLISMSNSSEMVRCAILAFSSLLYHRQQTPWVVYTQNHYEKAERELAVVEKQPRPQDYSHQRLHLLATIFFLSYVDILQGRVSDAHKHLKQAHTIFIQASPRSFRPIEVRLLSWLRILDGRAVSAGGEGLFLSDTSEALILVQPSPPTMEDKDDMATPRNEELQELDVEDALFQALYHPGILFFQKVQSFMGRISKIDPWHRSRGTVEDETEVMNIASRISKDLRVLYEERPALMDHAVAGMLKPPHVSQNLSYTITRAFRTYLANYYASKVHLHRVAYKNLPLPRETVEALGHIRNLTRSMVETLEPGSALPVSQLWPLLMLGSEEKDPAERAWIKEQILKMEIVATNATITAQVMEEVQIRQDSANARVDIRLVMHDIFDSCFAII
ncbi:fungal-specific transcription factor domain-containing protein [Stachybotrys elegans]|uniref:Fungal-specific transcription factor domain-containing protein n=1 Tax=Stachybotrys elegans TaxID=80388 RepID=A0A8K0T9G4_9HYPO|nr:fungal-specific transcription factor domain-containing protein [Stachybotrys elegans]